MPRYPLPAQEFEQLAELSRHLGLTDRERRLLFLRPTQIVLHWVEDTFQDDGNSSLFHLLQVIRELLGETLLEYLAWGVLEQKQISAGRFAWEIRLDVTPNGVETSFHGPKEWNREGLWRLFALQGWVRYARVEEYCRRRALLGSNVINNFEVFWVDYTTSAMLERFRRRPTGLLPKMF